MAEKGEPITTKMDVDISGLKAGFQEAKREIRMANSEFKAAASEMDFVGNSADGLQKKIAQLTAVQDGEIKKLESLKGQYQAVAQEQGENSTSAQELQIKINNQQAAVNKVTAQLKEYQDKLNDTQTASADLQSTINTEESELKNLKTAYTNVVLEQGDTSQAAQDLAKQIEDLSTELADNKKKLSDAEAAADSFDKSLDNVEDGAEGASGGFSIMKGALADFIGNTISGAIDKVGEFVGSLFDLSEETQEFRSNMTKVSGSADSFGYSIEDARGKFEQFYRYVGDDQMATNAITNLMGMKVSTETLDSVANGAIATWSAYGDSIPIESLTESITESANVGQVTGTLADTINWAKRSNDEWAKSMAGNPAAQKAFNAAVKDGESTEDAYSAALAACSTTQERADLIAQSLNDTYGNSKQRYDEMSGSILDANDAELKLKESQAQLGQAMEPVNTAITNLKTKALDAIAPAITTVVTGVGNLLNWFLQTPGAASIAVAVITAVAVAFGTLAAALTIQALVNGVQKAFALLNVTLLANPFVLIAAAIAGVVAALILLWNTNEGFRNAVVIAWNTVLTVISSVVNAIINFFTVTVPNGIVAMLTWFQNLPGNIATFLSAVITNVSNWAQQMAKNATNAAKNFLSNIVSGVKSLPSKFASFLTQVIGRVTSWGSNLVSAGKEKATAFVNSVVDFIKGLPGKAAEQLEKVVSKVTSWGSNLADKGKSAATKLVNAVVNGAKSLPSKMVQLGKDVVSGIWNGITGAAQTLYNNVKNFMQNILQNAKNAIKSNSPSKLWRDEIGKNIVSGIVVGIGQSTGFAIKSIVELSKKMINTALSANGNYTEVGKKAIESFSAGVDKNVKAATKSVEKFVDQQVKAFSKKHKKSKKKYEEAGKEVIEAYSNALTKAADKVKEKLTNKLDQISSAYQEKYDEIINLQNTMNQKLADYGDLYTIDENGNLVLGDIKKDINTLNQYQKNINTLKGKISDDLMNEIINMNVDDAIAYTNALLNMSEAELNNYNALYSQKLATANEISKNFYAGKLQEIQTQYSSKVEAAFADAKKSIQNAGKDAINGFVEGMAKSAKKNAKKVNKLANKIVKQFKKALKINSPSKVFEDMGLYSGEGYEIGLVKSLRKARDAMVGTLKGMTDSGKSGVGGSTQPKQVTYNFYQTNNSPKALSRLEIYRQSRNLLKGAAISV